MSEYAQSELLTTLSHILDRFEDILGRMVLIKSLIVFLIKF